MIKNHIHTYVRTRNSKSRYQCADPDCTHFNYRFNIEGKKSLCSNCSREMILTTYHLKCAKPKCDLCSDTKKAREIKKAMPEIMDILGGIESVSD